MSRSRETWRRVGQCAVLLMLGYAAYASTQHAAQLACDTAKLRLETGTSRGFGRLMPAQREKLEAVAKLCVPEDRDFGQSARILVSWLSH